MNNINSFTMKNFLQIVVFVLFIFHVNYFAQPITGIKTIPGDYATIEAAIAALNLNGVGSGGVTFNVAAGHAETFTSPTAGIITATGTSSDAIVFQKNGGGANPVITAGTGTGTLDGIIVIVGGDYITFDGIDVSENAANTDNTTLMEWGYALLKPDSTNGCRYVTIKNSNISLNKTNTATWGIYAANHTPNATTGLILADSLGVMSYCKFFSNTITNSYNGIRIISSTAVGFQGQNNEVGVDGGNTITGYSGGSASAYGTNLEYQNNLKVANNIVNNGIGTGQTGILYGIRTGSATNANIDIYNNTVTLTQGGTSLIYGITNSTGSSGVDNTVNIYNNTVENCLQPNSTSNNVWLIYNLASCYNLNIYGNIVRNNTKSAGTGTMYCIYNSPTTPTVNAQIYDNQVYNNTSAGPIHGINITDGTNTSIYKNKIYSITSNSTLTTQVVSGITVPSDPINNYIFNNFISDLKAPFSAAVDAIRGINITSIEANSNIGLYYNTIFLNASSGGANFGTTGIYHTNSSTATTAVLDMRNNIVVNNSTPNGTGKTVAFRRSAANVNLSNYSTVSNNNSFYAGTPGVNNVIFFDGTNFDSTITAFKSRVAPRETSSFTENVSFVNSTTVPYDLHIDTAIATQTESGGIPISSPVAITTDFDNDSRNASTPDVGADEFNGTGIDITPPFIDYTPLTHTTSTTNRTLTDVTITDGSGINTTPGTAPRVYYKRYSDANTYIDNTSASNGWKYTESSSASSPFQFPIDYSLLFDGTGVQVGDTVQYFVVAQDLADPANVGILDGIFAAAPSSVNLTSAAFPITGTINLYRIQFIISGTVTVGAGGNYSTLTGDQGLFVTMNENFVGGNVVAQITGDITEPGTNPLNQWLEVAEGNYNLTIQPDAAVVRTISGSVAGGLISINGADNVTIDGRFNGSGQYLSFQNTNAASNTATILVISPGVGAGATDITIRNSVIKAGSNTSSNIFGIFVGGTVLTTSSSGGADNNNITLLENNVSKCRVGIFTRGTTSNPMNNLIVSGNVVGSDLSDEYVTEYGINIQSAVSPVVTFNEVYNMVYDVSKWAIYFGSNITNAVVSKNKIHDIDQPGTTGFNSVGIYFSSSTGCSDNQIDNNMIYNINTYGNTSMYLSGIRIRGGNNYKVYYNSVNLSGAFGNLSAGIVSSCLHVYIDETTNIDIRNNIFSNTRTGNDPKNYTVHSPNTTTFLNINHNDYWSTGNVFGFFGADIANFNDWKTATGQDNNSINIDPMFASNTNLHINSGVTPIALESGGADISGITTDFDGDVRPGPAGSVNGGATAPDIGADEFDGVPYVLPPDTVYVNVMANFFDPADFTIDVGDFVKWTLVEENHTTTSDTIPPGAAPWDYTFTGIGDSYLYEVTVAGSYSYECLIHVGMEGTFTAIETNTFQLTVNVDNGWNMVSIPGLHPTDQNVNTWWAFRDMSASVFKFDNGYTAITTAVPGEGYWMKHAGDLTYNSGDEWPAINIVPHDPIDAVTGWNMIGPYENPAVVAGITTDPTGLIEGSIFGYSNGYFAEDTLQPGYGYWIKLSDSGTIHMPSALSKSTSKIASLINKDWGRIIITDASGKGYTLYAAEGEVNLNVYELPPAPPAGVFDVRYSSGRYAEDINEIAQQIDLNGMEYPVTVRAEGIAIRLQDVTGKVVNERLKSGEEVTISQNINKLSASKDIIPDKYALEQNYPNPFNPSTVIEFSIPENAKNVKLTIYNALGERVDELINGSFEPGIYKYKWNAVNLASGLYIYELRTEKFVSVKKMMLMK